MTARGAGAVWRVEWMKLGAQWNVRLLLAACAAGPIVFVAAVRVQSSLPEDTLFGRLMNESGFAAPLVVLGFAAMWLLPALASAVAGDLFSSEDRYATWATILTRSCTRADVFAGKVAVALAFATVATAVLAASSVAAGLVAIGAQPLIDLSGTARTGSSAFALTAAAWTSVLPAVWTFAAAAMLVSVATRSSAAGIAVPVAAGLVLQLVASIDGAGFVRALLPTSGFTAWRGLALRPFDFRPLAWAIPASVLYAAAASVAAYGLLRRREHSG